MVLLLQTSVIKKKQKNIEQAVWRQINSIKACGYMSQFQSFIWNLQIMYCRSGFFSRGWVIFLKLRINIFETEKPRLDFCGMKIYTEYNSFLNRGHDIFADWMPTAKIWWPWKNGDLQYSQRNSRIDYQGINKFKKFTCQSDRQKYSFNHQMKNLPFR